MKRSQQLQCSSWHEGRGSLRSRMATWLLLASIATFVGPSYAQISDSTNEPPPAVSETSETQKGHGSISVAYLNTLANGMVFAPNQPAAPGGTVRSRGVALDLDYYFADQWSVDIGIPFLSNRYDGTAPHCPTTAPPQCKSPPNTGPPPLSPQHPESQFLDDGKFHSAWQDWDLGVSYHTNIGDYYITPSITAYSPSHDYTFFANAAVGQDLWKLEMAISLAHQFEFSNVYYRVGYGYVFAEKTLGISINHSKLDLELGYFINEKLSVRMFGIGKDGDGLSGDELAGLFINPDGQTTNKYWYHHDQIAEHNYFGAGVGFDYAIGNRYTLSSSVQKLVWGESVFNFKYAFEFRLTKAF
jgi:hypothetical protein